MVSELKLKENNVMVYFKYDMIGEGRGSVASDSGETSSKIRSIHE